MFILLLCVVVTSCASDDKAKSVCKECIEPGRNCRIYIRQFEQPVLNHISACHSESEIDIKLNYYDDGFYECANSNHQMPFCIFSECQLVNLDAPLFFFFFSALSGDLELRLSSRSLSENDEVFVYIYVGDIKSSHHRQLWNLWVAYHKLVSGNTTIASETGFGSFKELLRVPFEVGGSPTAIEHPINNFYTAIQSKLVIKRGYCGDYRIYGVSAMINHTFDVFIESKLTFRWIN